MLKSEILDFALHIIMADRNGGADMADLALDTLKIIGSLIAVGGVLVGLYILASRVPVIYYSGSALAGGIFGIVSAGEDSSMIGEFLGGAFIALLVAFFARGWLIDNIGGECETSNGKAGRKAGPNSVTNKQMQDYVNNQNAQNIWFNIGFFGGLSRQNRNR